MIKSMMFNNYILILLTIIPLLGFYTWQMVFAKIPINLIEFTFNLIVVFITLLHIYNVNVLLSNKKEDAKQRFSDAMNSINASVFWLLFSICNKPSQNPTISKMIFVILLGTTLITLILAMIVSLKKHYKSE